MNIRTKIFGIVIGVLTAVALSVGAYIIITMPIRRMEQERKLLDRMQDEITVMSRRVFRANLYSEVQTFRTRADEIVSETLDGDADEVAGF